MQKTSFKKGSLEVVCGSMFSGKSEELIRRLRRAKIAQKPTIVFKPLIDTRRGIEHVTTHAGNKIEAIAVENALQIIERLPHNIEVVGIDEAQLFSHELISVVFDLVDAGKHVIIAGLTLDFRGVPFGSMPTFMALADKVTALNAICIVCGEEATFTQRIVNGNPARYDDPIIQVGGEECYQARCRNCFIIDKNPLWQKTL